MAITTAQLKIGDAEYRARCEQLLGHIRAQNLSGVVLFDSYYILYYTGFAFIPTERPMAFVMNRSGERGLFVPRLELEHAQANALIERVEHYKEYPDKPHPMDVLAKMLSNMGISGEVAADEEGYPWILGYRGPRLSEVAGLKVAPVRVFVEDQMAIKSPAELALIGESVRWANLAHMLLQRYTVAGATETAVSQRASDEATLAMMDAIARVSRESMFERARRRVIAADRATPPFRTRWRTTFAFQAGDVVTGDGRRGATSASLSALWSSASPATTCGAS
jgi:Xaa-Pro aminopeptidase